jgi:uroporphyrin-III C-methyltransferase/precorrin-2 dehydrogenase/sirohydrochlorin ferrochelatase
MNVVSPQSEIDSGLAYLPVFLGMRGRTALLIGGAGALPKLTLLRRVGAQVRLVAQQMDDRMADAIAGDRMVMCISGPLAAHHFDDAVVAIDASGDEATNRRSVSLARAAGVRINVVDRPALCDFILPAILDRSPVVVAISTCGLAPAVSRLIRQRLEAAIPVGFGRIALVAAGIRRMVRQRLRSAWQRANFWEDLLDGPAAQLALAGHMDGALAAAQAMIERSEEDDGETIHLLDVNSEDPDLLTVRAARLIRMADVILFEPGIGTAVLELARRDATKVRVQTQLDARLSLPSLEERRSPGQVTVCLRACSR